MMKKLVEGSRRKVVKSERFQQQRVPLGSGSVSRPHVVLVHFPETMKHKIYAIGWKERERASRDMCTQ